MPARTNETEFGHSCPPEGPHTVTIHAKGWDSAMGIRDGDMSVLSRLVSMYPRFAPWGLCRQVSLDRLAPPFLFSGFQDPVIDWWALTRN